MTDALGANILNNYFVILNFAAVERRMKWDWLFFLIFLLVCLNGFESLPCAPRDYGLGSVVCVCNSTYCDTLEAVTYPPNGDAILYESNKAGKRFSKTILQFAPTIKAGTPVVKVRKEKKYQTILGFGGAFTDSAGININSLPLQQQNDLIKSYFSQEGLEYTMGRVPMASCDCSTHPYSYDDIDGDMNLTNFKLTTEDLKFKIPFIKLAQSMSSHKLLLFASPWSAPGWMKTSGQMEGPGTLKGKPGGPYYQTWADYFVKFLQEYEKQNISFWGLTAQNEPLDGFIPGFSFQAMGFTAQMQRDFIKFNLGPTLKKAGFGTKNVKLMIMDDQRFLLPKWADTILSDPVAAQYVSGIAFHWYLNFIAPPVLLDIVHDKYPNMLLLPSEACTGSNPWEYPKVALGSWERGEKYAHDIIQDLLHWSVSWIDWNLALNMQGGPNWAQNYFDSSIIVNNKSNEFYKQPMYYSLAHFSKLLPRGSVRIGLENNASCLKQIDIAAFQTPKSAVVVIIVNRQNVEVPVVLEDGDIGYLNVTVTPRSIQSYAWLSNSTKLY